MTLPPDDAKPPPPKLKGRPSKARKPPVPISPATMELQRQFGADFRAAREASGLTQDQVARLIDASYQNVAAVEHGRRNLTIDVMRRLAVAVGCSLVLHLNPDGAPLSARLERDPSKKS